MKDGKLNLKFVEIEEWILPSVSEAIARLPRPTKQEDWDADADSREETRQREIEDGQHQPNYSMRKRWEHYYERINGKI